MCCIDKTHFIIHHESFTIIPNTLINNAEISFKAKGILAYLLSKPDNWRLIINDLISHSKDGRDSVYAGLKELRIAGYLVLDIIRNQCGQIFQYVYHVYSTPVSNESLDTTTPQTVTLYTENPDEDMQETYNIDISNTEVNKTEVKKKEDSAHTRENFPQFDETNNNSQLDDEKFEYLAGVYLSLNELYKLEEKYGEDTVDKMIDRYQEYKTRNNKQYYDDYIALARWLEKDKLWKQRN